MMRVNLRFLNRINGEISLRFAGIPMGHEFTSLVLALLQVGGHPSVAQEVIEQIANLEGGLTETYFCCLAKLPDVVQALNLMAVLNQIFVTWQLMAHCSKTKLNSVK